jgi:hypothetical protein
MSKLGQDQVLIATDAAQAARMTKLHFVTTISVKMGQELSTDANL